MPQSAVPLEVVHRPRRPLIERAIRWMGERYGDDIDARVDGIVLAKNDAGVDPFGFDPETARAALAVLAWFHRAYFRTQVFGVGGVPRGRALFVANHSGQVPVDGMMIEATLLLDANPPVFARSMVEKWTQSLPFLSMFFPRVGQVLGDPDNARRLLAADQPLLVFPEGSRGVSKPFARRYQLGRLGTGFMRLALETHSPIVPISVVGAEEQYPSLGDLKPLARLLGMPSFPVIPQLFVGMLLPLPTRYRLYFGEPMRFVGDPDEDDAEIEEKVAEVRTAIERGLERGLAEREHVFW